MATIHNITSTFTGKNAANYLRAALLTNKTMTQNAVDIRDNIQFKEVIQLITSDANLIKPASCDFNATGELTTTEVVLEPTEFQVNLTVCTKNFRSSWESLQMRGVKAGLPRTFGEFILEHVVQKTAAAVESAIWTNSTSSTDIPFNGWEALAAADSTVIDVSASSVTADTVTTELGKVVDAIPSAVYSKDDLFIFVPTAIYQKYIRALGGFGASGKGAAGLDNQGNTWYNGQDLFFDGIKLIHAPGMTSSKMMAGLKSNFIVGSSLFSENAEASIIDMSSIDGSQNARVILRGSLGVQIGIGAETVLYS
mgnify:CR=1 FL=1|tara:strand:+ start:23782 stop:24711 length:930 start_codon:yes stop_codon:yes gene_type:complete